MVIVRNLVDFERQLQRALSNSEALAASRQYVGEIRIVGFQRLDEVVIKLPAVGRMAGQVFRSWVETKLRPALIAEFGHLGHHIREAKIFVR